MGPIVTRLFNAARPPKQRTIKEEAEASERDPISMNPGEGPDEEGMLKTPNRRMAMRRQYPNPKREL